MRILTAVYLSAIVLAAGTTQAQDSPENASDNSGEGVLKAVTPANPSLFAFGYGATSTPALNLLGLTASKVQSSTGFTPFFLSVPSLLDGSSGQSISLDVSPSWAMQAVGQKLYLQVYPRDNPFMRALIRARLEIAATNGTDSTNPTKLQQSGVAAAFSTALLRANDPFASEELSADYQACIAPLLVRADQAIQTSWPEWNRHYAAAARLALLLSSYKDKRASTEDAVHQSYELDIRKHAAEIRDEYNVIAKGLGHRSLGESAESAPVENAPNQANVESAEQRAPKLTEMQAFAELRDVFDAYNTTDQVSKAKASAYAREMEDIAKSNYQSLPPPDTSVPVEIKRQDVAQYAATVSDDGSGGTIKRLVSQPEFGSKPSLRGYPPTNSPELINANEALAAEIDQRFLDLLSDADKIYNEKEKAYNQLVIAPALASRGVTQDAATCSTATAALAAAKADLNVGIGYVGVGTPGRMADLHDGGKTAWVAYRLPLPWFSNMDPHILSWDELANSQGHYFMAGGSVTYSYHASLTTGQATVPIMEANVLGHRVFDPCHGPVAGASAIDHQP